MLKKAYAKIIVQPVSDIRAYGGGVRGEGEVAKFRTWWSGVA
jgi:hypothetical protein